MSAQKTVEGLTSREICQAIIGAAQRNRETATEQQRQVLRNQVWSIAYRLGLKYSKEWPQICNMPQSPQRIDKIEQWKHEVGSLHLLPDKKKVAVELVLASFSAEPEESLEIAVYDVINKYSGVFSDDLYARATGMFI